MTTSPEPSSPHRILFGLGGALLLLSLLSGGCANPARDVPPAEVGAAAPASAAAASTGTSFSLSPDSKVGFVGSKLTGSHEGGFRRLAGEIDLRGGKVEGSEVRILLDASSLWADNERLQGHLRSADFFDVVKHPTAAFRSTAIRGLGGERYQVTGNLDLHGVEKSVSFPATITVAADRISVQSEFAINRFDFDIRYPGKPDDLIREEVVIRLDVHAVPGRADFTALEAAARSTASAPAAAPAGGRPARRLDRQAILERFDTDKDGQLSETEREAMAATMRAERTGSGD